MGLGLILFILLISLAIYVFCCFCAKRICEKCGVNPGVLIWIPIANLVPLLQVAKMPVWMIILFLHPDRRHCRWSHHVGANLPGAW